MARICFEHPEITAWYEKTDEGSSTFDVCTDCFSECGETAEDLNLTDKGYNGDPIPAGAEAVDTYTGPPIEDCDGYTCSCCGTGLNEDNY